ncbi:MAG: tRNA-intron lyase [Candidatus Woesearchaeota archaeon]
MPKRTPIKTWFSDTSIITDDSNQARELYNKSRYGIVENNKVKLSILEGLYLLEKERIVVYNKKNKEFTFDSLFRTSKKHDSDLNVRYPVFRDLRERGYIVKTALKFGADFRVYNRGIKPGEDHARWVVYAVHESQKQTWFDFAAKSRVAHSTRKNLMIGIVDAEADVTYYEVEWIRP